MDSLIKELVTPSAFVLRNLLDRSFINLIIRYAAFWLIDGILNAAIKFHLMSCNLLLLAFKFCVEND